MCQLFTKLGDLIKGGIEMLSPERAEGGPVSGSVFAKRLAWAIDLTEAVVSGATAAVLCEEPSLWEASRGYSGAWLKVKSIYHTREQSCSGEGCWDSATKIS